MQLSDPVHNNTIRVFDKMSRLCLLVYTPFLVGLYLQLIHLAYSQDNCDPRAGPPGHICHYDSTADKLIWSSCVSKTYVRIKSAGADQCEREYDYCLYGCLDEGVLVDDCVCPEPNVFTPVDSSTAWCFDPPGDNTQQCIWYRECLDRMRPCEDSDNGYALAYGERFCNLYKENVEDSLFTQDAVNWIDGVRKCLQVALVPLIRPWHSPTCRQIQDVAFASHTGCYLSPAPDAPGICSLGFRDWLAVFWTIKGSFISAPIPSLRGLVETAASGCRWKFDLTPHPVRWLRLQLRLLLGYSSAPRAKRSALGVGDAAVSQEIADRIAQRLDWDGRTLDWFGYAPEPIMTTNDDDNTKPRYFNILIVDKLTMGLTTAPDAPLINLNRTTSELVSLVGNGTLDMLHLSNGNVSLVSITECNKMGCADKSSPNSASSPWHITPTTVFLVAITASATLLASL